jgi:hypothetical protein
MTLELASLLPTLLPRAIAWAEVQQQHILTLGLPLSSQGIALARSVGVQKPENIRVHVVDTLPLPEDPMLKDVALQTGLLGPGMVGLTLGYGIFLCKGYDANPQLISHECRHVHQYEVLGSIQEFLPVYLAQIAQFGYQNAPLEVDARAYETGNA